MKRFVILLFLAITILPLFAQQELESCLKTAADNNASLKAAFSEYRAALEMLPQAKALPDPQVMFRYFTTPLLLEMGKQQFTVSASQMFPWFGQLSAQGQAAAEMAQAKYETFIEERNRLFYEVKSVYYMLYVQHKSVRITSESLELLYTMRELAKTGFETGRNSFANVLRADMEIAETENRLAYLKDSEWPLKAELEKYLNAKSPDIPAFPDVLWQDSLPGNKTFLLDSLAANNPELKKADHEIAAWEKKLRAAKKMGHPSFTVGAEYMNMSERTDVHIHSGNGKDMYVFPEIGVMIPLYRKKYNAMVNEARYNGEAASFEKTNMMNSLSAEMEKEYRDYLDARRKVILYSRLQALAKDARELLLVSFSAAGTDFEEVLRMQERELMYAMELEDARAMLNTSVAYIDYLTGKQ